MTGVRLDYPRFARAGAPDRITIALDGAADGALALRIDRAVGERLRVERVSPAPHATAIDANGTLYLFLLRPGASGRTVLDAKPASAGPVRGRIAVNGAAQPFRQIVWP